MDSKWTREEAEDLSGACERSCVRVNVPGGMMMLTTGRQIAYTWQRLGMIMIL